MGMKKEGEVDEYAEDENKERGNWSGKLDFLLSAIGYAVGLGNVWRFPYRAYDNGGASFLIPYVIVLCTAGLPLFLLEMTIGQFSSQGPITMWDCTPFFRGIGWAMLMVSAMVGIYYNMIIAYTFRYLFASFTSELPWQRCQPEWITKWGCVDRDVYANATYRNITDTACNLWKEQNLTDTPYYIGNCTRKSPSEVYWTRIVLDRSDGVGHDVHVMKWDLCLCLLLAWILVFVCLIKGIKSSGKVVYVTATFPYIVLIILCIRNATLDGAIDGIRFYIIPDWARLADRKVWYTAAIQIFYSLGVGFGGLEVMASYNKFKNNVYRDAILVSILNCSTSVFAGFVIFSAVGFMSKQTGLPVSEVVDAGPGLAFVAYPEGIAMMPLPPLWSILFFAMLLTLGLDSQFAMIETVTSALTDVWPALRPKKAKIIFTAILCISLFIMGLPQCSRAGIYIVNLFEWYCAGYSVLLIAMLESIAIAYFYGYKNFSRDFQMIMGFKPNVYWLANWLFLSPAVVAAIGVLQIIADIGAPYATLGSYRYPQFANNAGWAMVGLAAILVPLLMLIEVCKHNSLFKALKPLSTWGPAVSTYWTGDYAHLNEVKGDHMSNGMTPVSPPHYSKSDIGKPNLGYSADAGDTRF